MLTIKDDKVDNHCDKFIPMCHAGYFIKVTDGS